MACCKCCCGQKDCAEGDQGKCCCGGASGTCCEAGQYCCSGACQSSPCSCTADIGAGTGSTDCAETQCCNPSPCADGYWQSDVGDCICWEGDMPGDIPFVDAPSIVSPYTLNDYAFTTWTLCCEWRAASSFTACYGYPP